VIPTTIPPKPWVCIPGINAPVRLNTVGDIQCMSSDGKNCLWQTSSQNCSTLIVNPIATVNPLTCGADSLAKWGATGYDTPGNWCNTACKTLDGCKPSTPLASTPPVTTTFAPLTTTSPTTLAPVNYNNVNFTNKIIQSRVSSAPVCFDNYSGGNGAQLKLYQCSGTNGGGAGTNQWSTVTNNSIQVGNKCIDSLKDVPNQGDPIGLWDCNQGTHQNFEFDSTGHIKYHDTTGNTMCVNTPNSATANGTGLIFWPCQDGANSLWYQN
jgi:hypothetical protein